jgi:glycerol-3-phosphate cytidylyltransferase
MNIGFTCSTFDLFHAGHVLMLKEAKTQCDYLIVGLQTDPTTDRPEKNTPIQSVFERFIQLQSCKYVDEIIPYASESELVSILLSYPIDIRIIGEDYKNNSFTGNELPIQIYYNKRKHNYSTTELRNRIFDVQQTLLKW